MSTARDEILGRVRQSLRDLGPERPAPAADVERGYRQSDPAPREDLVAHFVARVAEYKASVRRVVGGELARAIADACTSRGVRRLVVPPGFPDEWLPPGVELLRDPGLSVEQVESSDGVLTTCALGVAQTGTIVLDAGPGQGRRLLTLLPDYHLCVVRADQIVGLVPEAVARLGDAARAPGRPQTWISGPSATSDIELNRVEGVHGPRTLEVLVVE